MPDYNYSIFKKILWEVKLVAFRHEYPTWDQNTRCIILSEMTGIFKNLSSLPPPHGGLPVEICFSKESMHVPSIVHKKGFFHSQSHSHAGVVSTPHKSLCYVTATCWVLYNCLFHGTVRMPVLCLTHCCRSIEIVSCHFKLIAQSLEEINKAKNNLFFGFRCQKIFQISKNSFENPLAALHLFS